MNRKERRLLKKEQHAFTEKLPERLTEVPSTEFPPSASPPQRIWRSRNYMVQLYDEANKTHPLLLRLSICRTKITINGQWQDGLSWDELQAIKSEIGFEDWYGVEVYPPNKDIVNVANMRHLWLLPTPLDIGWR